jgi:hypothetical protein
MVAPPQTTSVIVNNSDVIFDASSRCFIGTPVYATELAQSLMHRCNKPVDKTTRPVPVECLFSTTGLLLNAKRSSLAPYKVNMITFNHDNYD